MRSGAPGADAPVNLRNDALAALEGLRAMLEVDTGTRAATTGQARTSELERLVLASLLVQPEARPARLLPSLPCRDWLRVLHEADDEVSHAGRALAHD